MFWKKMVMKSHSPSKTPAVSVVVPVYNTAPYLKQCLDSLLDQTLEDMEIIAVDDGSTDESGKIIDAYAKRFKQIIPVHKKNGGVASAYNTGIKHAKGKYIGFLDSDDWTDKKMYETLWIKAKDIHADVIKSNSYWLIGRRKKKTCIPAEKCGHVIRKNTDIPQFVYGHPCHWTAIYKTSFLKKHHILMTETPRESAADVEFIYKVWLNMRSLYIVPKAFVHYRLNRPSSDRNSGAKMSFYLLNVHAIVQDYFKKKKVKPIYWQIKTYSEFWHLKFELQERCLTRRKEFISALSKLFWANLDENHFSTSLFPWKDLLLYHVIACVPFLYYLNDLTRFWITRPASGGYVAKWRLFGLWRTEKAGRLAPIKSTKVKRYILGICISK